MLHLMIGILGVLLTIFFVVGIHEFGHFIVARLVGVKVLRFSIGFGKALFRWHDKKGTEYVFAAIPLGGYVKMLGEADEAVPPEELHLSYERQSPYKKLAIVSAGPLFNFIFAFVIYWAVYVIGFTSIIPVIGKITPNSIAAQAGLQPQQEISSINNKPTSTWMSVLVNLIVHTGEKIELPIETKNITTQQTKTYTLNLNNWQMDNLKPDPLESIGIAPYDPEIPAVIGTIAPDSSAKGVLKIGDKILFIGKTPIKDWYGLALVVEQHPGTTLAFTIERQKQKMIVQVPISYARDLFFAKHGRVGIAPHFNFPTTLLRHNQYGPVAALTHAWQSTYEFTYMNFNIFSKLFTGQVSFKSLGGPITIFEGAGSALNNGLIAFLSFLAFISISIGFVNILPIPGLDGGHALFQLIELVIRRPIPSQVQLLFIRLGLVVILLLLTQALVNDILRL